MRFALARPDNLVILTAMRGVLISFGLTWMSVSAAAACSLTEAPGAANVADYVDAAQDCLQSPPDGIRFDERAELYFAAEVNRRRAVAGLGPLFVRPELQSAARIHALDLIATDYFSHTGRDGQIAGDRIAAMDRSLLLSAYAENLSRSAGTIGWQARVSGMMQGLMDSPGHRAAILDPEMTHMAMGVAVDGDTMVLTQLFVREVGVLPEPLAPRQPSGPAAAQTVILVGWQAREFSWTDQAGQDARLTVLAERRVSDTERLLIELGGPAVTLEPASEKAGNLVE